MLLEELNSSTGVSGTLVSMAVVPNPPLVAVDEYLNSSYRPDMEYEDGVLVERNVGDWLHSTVQSNLVFVLRTKYPRVYVRPELRSQTKATRYRLPDVCVVLARPKTKYLVEAAFLAIEVLSEDDCMTKVMERLEEFDRKGVPNIWVIDPRRKKAFTFEGGRLQEVEGGFAAGAQQIHLPLEDVFRGL